MVHLDYTNTHLYCTMVHRYYTNAHLYYTIVRLYYTNAGLREGPAEKRAWTTLLSAQVHLRILVYLVIYDSG